MPELLGQAELELSTTGAAGVEAEIDSVKDKATSLADGFMKAGLAVSAIGIPFAAAAKSAIDTADEIGKMATKTGVSTEMLSGLSYAADLANVEFGSLGKGLGKLSGLMADAADGNEKANKTFEELGISVKDASGELKGSDKILLELADSFKKMQDGPKKTALAIDIFSKAGMEMIPLLNEGAEGLEDMFEQNRKFGNELSRNTTDAAEDFNDSLTTLNKSMAGLGNALIKSGLLEALTSFALKTADIIGRVSEEHPLLVQIAVAIGAVSAVVGPLLIALGAMVSAITAIGPVVGTVITILSGPVGWVVALSAVAIAIGTFLATNETARTTIANIWSGIKTAVDAAITPMKTAIEAFGNGIIAGFTALKNALVGGPTAIWNSIWTAVENAIKAPFTAVSNAISNFKGGVEGAFKSLKDVLVGHSIVPDMMDDIQSEFNRLDKDGPAGKSIKSRVTESMGSIGGAFSDGMKNISGTFSDGLTGMLTGRTSFSQFATDLLDSFVKLGTDVIDTLIKSFFKPIEDMISAFVKDMVGRVVGAVTGGASGGGEGGGGGSGSLDFIGATLGSIATWFSGRQTDRYLQTINNDIIEIKHTQWRTLPWLESIKDADWSTANSFGSLLKWEFDWISPIYFKLDAIASVAERELVAIRDLLAGPIQTALSNSSEKTMDVALSMSVTNNVQVASAPSPAAVGSATGAATEESMRRWVRDQLIPELIRAIQGNQGGLGSAISRRGV